MGLLRDGGLSIGLKLGRFALGIGSAVLLNWLMPIHDYGIYAFALSISLLLAIPGEAGMPQLAIRELSRARVEGDTPRMRGFVLFANATVFALVILIALLTALTVWLLGSRVSTEMAWLLAISVPALLLGSLANTRAGILRALGSPVLSQVPEQIVRPASLILAAGILYLVVQRQLSSIDAMGAYLVSSGIAFLFGTALLYSAWRRTIGPGPRTTNVGPWLAALLPFSAIACLQSALAQLSTVILGLMAAPSEVALFRIATLAADFAIFPVFALNTVIAPEIARHYHRGNIGEVEMLISRANRLNLALALAVTAGLVVLGPFALHIAFGPEYRDAWLPMCLIAAGHVGSTAVGYVALLANMSGRERLTIVGSVLGLVLNSTLAVLLCARYGALGAAIATATSAVIWRVAMAIRLKSLIGVRAWAFKWTLDRTDLTKLKL